ncbi:MAG: DNA-processing protein DprA [Bacteroidetes bacterium]|nr:DNA-processing protein DprA [Bacteroidota bacterium]
MNKQELMYGVALKNVPNIGDKSAKSLISYCGSAEAVFKTKKNTLLKIPDIGEKSADSVLGFKEFDKIVQEIEFAEAKGINIYFYFDKEYPQRLKECADSPLYLFVKGKTDLNNSKVLAVVGTRNATQYGKEFCYSLGKALNGTNCLIVSGLAFGIDTYAHKEALNNHLPTAAVFGHGLRTISPPRNRNLAKEILDEGGALITEHLSDEPPNPENFPKRNRIVAGMCDGLIIVESGIRGGSMITAELAWGYDREIFALPGRITDSHSLGCNRLISTNKAMGIENAEKLVEYLGWNQAQNPKKIPAITEQNLSENEKKVFNLMRSGEKHIDSLFAEAGMGLSELSMLLLDLEFKGIVVSLPGKVYKLRS